MKKIYVKICYLQHKQHKDNSSSHSTLEVDKKKRKRKKCELICAAIKGQERMTADAVEKYVRG